MTSLLLTLLLAYALMLVFMGVFQRRLMYFPDTNVEAPAYYGLDGFEDIRTQSSGGAVQMWYRGAAAGFPTIVYFHGNASHLGFRAKLLAALARQGFGVLALHYRGYGKSEGRPFESGLYDDARAAMHYLATTLHVSPAHTLLYGESLGTGVATQMATEFDIAGLMLQAPYTSVSGRAAEIYYYLPVKLLIRDRYDSLAKIPKVRAPVMIFHGELDSVIPPTHGRALLEAATTPSKRGFFFPHTGHNDFDSGVISAHVLDFAKEHRLIAH